MIGDEAVILEPVGLGLALAQQGLKILGRLQPVAFSAMRLTSSRRIIGACLRGIRFPWLRPDFKRLALQRGSAASPNSHRQPHESASLKDCEFGRLDLEQSISS
jgi:hypothetical protein